MKNPFFNELTPLFLLFLAALGLQGCTREFYSCREQRLPSRHSAWAACCDGFPCCGAQRLGARASPAAASGLSSCGTVSPRHVGSSRTRGQARVPCIGRRILIHCTIREVLLFLFLMF